VEEVNELIRRYGLEEDLEYVIIPLPGRNGQSRRCYLLKRRFIRIVYPEGQTVDYPLADAIEATIRYPDLLLSEALYLLHKEREPDAQEPETAPEDIREGGDTVR
jgi:hypothetical protein